MNPSIFDRPLPSAGLPPQAKLNWDTTAAASPPASLLGWPIDNFMDGWAAQLAAMPHHRQAVIMAFPNGFEARELAAKTVLAMEEKGWKA